MIGVNTEIKQFRNELSDVVNKYNLPIEVKRMVVNNLNLELDMAVQMAVQEELAMMQKENEQKEEKENDLHSDRNSDEQ